MKTHELNSQPNEAAGSSKRNESSSTRRLLVGLTIASGIVAVGWSMRALPTELIQRPAAAATKAKSGTKSASKAEVEADEPAFVQKRIKLNYFSASWSRVFQDLADANDMEFINDHLPTGRFSRYDKTEYNRKDAMRIINKEIEPQGLRLIEKGQFLILIETSLSRPQYAPAVLPKKNQPKPAEPVVEEPEVASKPSGFKADSITPVRDSVDRAVHQVETAEKPTRYPSNDRYSNLRQRSETADSEAQVERPYAARKVPGSKSVRQTSHEEADDPMDVAPRRRPHPVDSEVPPALDDVGAPAPHAVYRARNLRAAELSKRIYRALKSSAEKIDSGRNGLPAFRIVGPQSKPKDGQAQPNGSQRPVEFMISIDEDQNELLIDGTAKDTAAVIKLLKVLDQPDDGQSRTQIKSSTKYVCQIADKLPAEIDRIRAARGSDPIARHQVDGKPLWIADEKQRRVPAVEEGEDEPEEEMASRARSGESDRAIGESLGNFKGEVNIEVIDDLNVMIIRGNERDVDQIMRVIKQIEQLSEATAPQVHLRRLKNVDAESLAELLTSVYEKLTKFPGRATQPRESVAIIAVTKPNALLIVAPEADLETILDLADQLDQPVDPTTEFQVFRLKSAIALDVETLLTEFYKERKSLGAKILVIADPRSNAIIVRARPRDLDEIKALIKNVDREEVGAVNQVKIFRLKNAVATELSAVINAAIQSVLSPPASSGSGGGGGQGPTPGLGGGQVDEQFKSVKSAAIQFLSVEKGGASRQFKSGILSDIRITPDTHANSLIVTASEKSMNLVEALIQALDKPTTTVSEIKVFTLENADANLMVTQLNSLFNGQQQGAGQGGNQQRQQLGIALAGADDSSSSLVPLKFSVDTRTNSVIAVGSGDALKVVEAILFRLDESNLRMRKNEVVRLNNAPVTQIAQAVTLFFQQQRDLSQGDPNLVSNVEQLEREVIVIPDTISNNLLVSATPRYFPSIMEMIKRLDAPPKQVVIQALIVEVQLNNTDEFGIELGLQSPVLFDRSLKQTPITQTTTNTSPNGVATSTQNLLSVEGTPGFNFNNPGVPLGNNILSSAATVGGQSLTNFSLGRTNSQLGYGGLVLSAGSNSVNALLRALSAKTKIQILSRPQIRAVDSQPASVFVGQTIPTVTGFQTNQTTGVISPQLTQRDTGIGMDVTPRINQEGNIVINLYAYRSQLSQQTINVTTDSRGQPIGQRITDVSQVRSTVLVPANSTIVIGGMISSRDETSVRRAPFISDIPVVGSLFRYDSRTTVRTELLIFLTPRIVNGAEEEECLKEIEMGRLHFIESEAEEVHGPLRAIQAPDDLFDDGQTPWIPGVPPSPSNTTQPSAMPTYPSQMSPTPMTVPPSPQTGSLSPQIVPPSPPIPDPNLTRINALRAMSTEHDDDSKSDGVATAGWTTPAKPKKTPPAPKRIFDSQK